MHMYRDQHLSCEKVGCTDKTLRLEALKSTPRICLDFWFNQFDRPVAWLRALCLQPIYEGWM